MALLSLFDHLYCQEENLELEEERFLPPTPPPPLPEETEPEWRVLSGAEAGEEWEAVLASLAAREGESFREFVPNDGIGSGGDCRDECYIRSARKGAVEWIASASSRHGFSALTVMLAVSYLDRCFLPWGAGYGGGLLLRLQDDKPWMGRLAAVACLSLAAKVEETRVPHLIDLQVTSPPESGGGEYVFETKTVRRMELLVLSALGWRMNPVTPFSFTYHLLPRLCSKEVSTGGIASATDGCIVASIRALVRRCEAALLSVIADRRWVRYPASIWAAAALLHATASADRGGAAAAVEADETRRLIPLLKAPKEKVEECSRLLELKSIAIIDHKRKHPSSPFHSASSPPSPNGVIGSCFSCESSCDSWATWPPSSPEAAATPPFKKLNDVSTEESFTGGEGVNYVRL